MGNVNNNQVIDFYRTNPPHVFINVSSSEGVPVSIMEAISFGIPIIATDVGGNPEICIENYNGFLLNKDFSNQDLQRMICRFKNMSQNIYHSMCINSRKVFDTRFNIASAK